MHYSLITSPLWDVLPTSAWIQLCSKFLDRFSESISASNFLGGCEERGGVWGVVGGGGGGRGGGGLQNCRLQFVNLYRLCRDDLGAGRPNMTRVDLNPSNQGRSIPVRSGSIPLPPILWTTIAMAPQSLPEIAFTSHIYTHSGGWSNFAFAYTSTL